jgi:hypothetical protein
MHAYVPKQHSFCQNLHGYQSEGGIRNPVVKMNYFCWHQVLEK